MTTALGQRGPTATDAQAFACCGAPVLLALMVLILVVRSAVLTGRKRAADAARHLAARHAADAAQYAARHAYLIGRFGKHAAEGILRQEIWQGMTEEMLLEALGRPAMVDQKVMKSKVQRVAKYRPKGAGRFGLRVTTENGAVVGWDQKD